MTQSQVAGQIGVQPNYIVYLEKGERKPSDKTVRKVSDALGLNKADLYLAANPQVREFLKIDDHNQVVRDEVPDGLLALSADTTRRHTLGVTDDEIDVVARLRLNGRVTSPDQYLALILTLRYVFA
jgi:transcriptional regulator with XRE-family HTH domain